MPARAAWVVLLLSSVALSVHGHCPNFCNGHGRCVGPNKCQCFDAWEGGDCSIRRCPFDNAWADVAIGNDVAHQSAECSNRGVCNHKTGVCTCFRGYEGLACNRMICPDDCNGHGRCRSMRYHASRMPEGLPRYDYGMVWDADLIFGCACDKGWTGYSCALRVAPTGDDPMTTGQVDEIQLLRCDLDVLDTDAAFTLEFREDTTVALSGVTTAAELEAALEELPSIRDVSVSYESSTGTVTTLCTINEPSLGVTATSSNVVKITFLSEFGDLPDLVLHNVDGSAFSAAKTAKVHLASAGGTLTRAGDGATLLSQSGTKEDAPCSGRGFWNTLTGECECYTGYMTSDGRSNKGSRADCGFDVDPITSCPGVEIECSGNGVCSNHPEYRCTCNAGYTGGDCSERVCPSGKAWFGAPTALHTAHHLAECSNKGACDRKTGTCKCQLHFEGEACHRMVCPAKTSPLGVCSGHGACRKMAEMAENAVTNGDATPFSYGATPNKASTWDWDSVYGCVCDEGFQGYDCSERVCPKGDDVTTTGQEDEIQSISCRFVGLSAGGTSPTFSLKFRQHSTPQLPHTISASGLKAALEALPSITEVVVAYKDVLGAPAAGPDEACPSTNSDNIIFLWFKSENGDVPPVTVTLGSGFSNGVELVLPSNMGATEERKGTTENAECSGRGICDHETGRCACFPGFGSSNGSGGAGGRGDCGYREPYFRHKSEVHRHW